jgi:hypothetical protein
MISLAELLSLMQKSTGDKEQSEQSRLQATELLQRLIVVDPDRKARYHDLINNAASS